MLIPKAFFAQTDADANGAVAKAAEGLTEPVGQIVESASRAGETAGPLDW